MKRWFASLSACLAMLLLFCGSGFSQENGEKTDIKFKLLWQVQDDFFQPGLDCQGYNWYRNWKFDRYFGDWCWLWVSDYTSSIGVGTFTRLYGYPGLVIPLHEMRTVRKTELQNKIGAEVELRIEDDLWLGAAYIPHKSYLVDTTEEWEVVKFTAFDEVYADEKEGYYEYVLEGDRYGVISNTQEKFSTTNFQFFLKQELGDNVKAFGGIGLDIWRLSQEVEQKKVVCNMDLWSGTQIIMNEEDITRQTNSVWRFRPFLMVGMEIPLYGSLSLGGEARVFPKSKRVGFKTPFVLYVSKFIVNSWELQLPTSELAVYLSINF